jgi:hypothetical protein
MQIKRKPMTINDKTMEHNENNENQKTKQWEIKDHHNKSNEI